MNKASYKQINFIKTLAKDCGYATRERVDAIDFTTLTQREASKWIDELKKESGWGR